MSANRSASNSLRPGLGDESLLPEIFERALENADHSGPSDRKRPRDRVRLIAELVGDPPNSFLRLLGDLQSAQGVGHGGGRQAGGIGDIADGDALGGLAHVPQAYLPRGTPGTLIAGGVDNDEVKRFA